MERGKAGARDTDYERVNLKELNVEKLSAGPCQQGGAGDMSVGC